MHPGVKATEAQVVAALTTDMREHQRFLLHELLDLIEVQDRSISHLETEIERHLRPFEEQIKYSNYAYSNSTAVNKVSTAIKHGSGTVFTKSFCIG